MGMSTRIIGFVPPDDEWRKMRAVYDTCMAAGVPVPPEVDDFFGGSEPDEAGREVAIPRREWKDDMREGFEVDLTVLPPSVKVIRFYNSW